ncbi:hypothetical protein GTO27_11510, partial [Candidatus Bathyarchaeota archaeon]|nr:hypothetical protein [Candidatus Bathyarchaeota archaeon]
MQLWKFAATLLRVGIVVWMLTGIIVLPGQLKKPYWAQIISWSLVFLVPCSLAWLLSSWCVNKAALLSKRELKEVEVSEQERETTITHSALETDEKARVEKDTLKQEEKAGEIQGEHDMQISSLTERIAQKQKAEAVVIEDRGADCRHENVIHVPVF